MLLTVDIGNSNITLGLVRNGRLAFTRRADTAPAATPDQLELLLGGLLGLDEVSLSDVTAVALASVVPSLSAAVVDLAERHGIPCVVAGVGTVPIAVRVDRPAEVGADRLVNALAAQRIYGAPCVVLDFGTATTVDAVAPDGAYVGGAIAPGLELGVDALAARTARLPRVELRTPERAIGRDTVGAIQAGVIFGYQALASGLLARVRVELADAAGVEPADVRTIATGGLSAAPWIRGVEGLEVVDPELTLKGLAILHAEVSGGDRLEPGLR